MTLRQIAHVVPETDSRTNGLLVTCSSLAGDAIREVRTMPSILHPPILDEAGLVSGLRSYTKLFGKRSGVEVNFTLPENLPRLPKEIDLTIFCVIQEADHESPKTDVFIFTMHFSEDVAREVLRCGARGYVLKSDADVELVADVLHAQQHKPFFTGRLATTMVDSFVHQAREDSSPTKHPLPGCPLTVRELEIVQLLAPGKIGKEVAAAVGISTRTVESHRNHIIKKMNFSSFSELTRVAIRNHLVEP